MGILGRVAHLYSLPYLPIPATSRTTVRTTSYLVVFHKRIRKSVLVPCEWLGQPAVLRSTRPTGESLSGVPTPKCHSHCPLTTHSPRLTFWCLVHGTWRMGGRQKEVLVGNGADKYNFNRDVSFRTLTCDYE